MYAEVAKSYGKKESSVPLIVKKEKEIHAVLLLHLRLQKLWPQCVISALVKIEKSIKFV